MTIESARARVPAPAVLAPIELPQPGSAARASPSPSRAPNALLTQGDAQRDQTVRRFVEARLGNGVLYVGMNATHSQCDREAALLARTGPGARRSIGHSERDVELGPDRVRLPSEGREGDSAVVDLATPEGAHAFVDTLGISEETATALVSILVEALPGSRDELGALASVFARGERGEDVPSRLVLSGHCTGESVYDGSGVLGALRFADVLSLARAMPRAAAQIEDVMLSACNSGHENLPAGMAPAGVAIGAWRESFPNLKTVWAYAGAEDAKSRSPTGDAALKHIEAWELATRGRQEQLNPRRAIHRIDDGRGVGYEGNVSIWSVRDRNVQSARTR